MRPPGTPHQLQKRREHAVQLLKSNKTLSAVARVVSASPSSVLRWQRAYQRHGPKGLQAKPIPGRPPRLSPAQKKKLEQELLEGPLAAGYRTDLWTLKHHTGAAIINFRYVTDSAKLKAALDRKFKSFSDL